MTSAPPKKNFYPVDELSEAQARQLHHLYQNEWWTATRSLPQIQTMLTHSDFVFGVCESPGDSLVGFVRVLTDRVFKAFILDLIIRPDLRGQGLGNALIERVLHHPELAGINHFELYCLPEMMPYYQQWGFEDTGNHIRLMRLDRSGNR